MNNIEVGTELPGFTLPPLKQSMLNDYAQASGDHNPIHLDPEAAKKAGLPGVIAPGMFVMGNAGRVVIDWLPQTQLRKFNARFKRVTQLGDVISFAGKVVELIDEGNEVLARCEIQASREDGEKKLVAEALVVIKSNS